MNNLISIKSKDRIMKMLVMLFIGLVFLLLPMSVEAKTVNSKEVDVEKVLREAEPKLVVDSYELVEGEISKGEKFILKVNVLNTNPYADAYNVLVTYTSETDNVRVVDGKANQHYEEHLEAGGTFSYLLELEVLDYFEMDTMVMDFIISYVGIGDGDTTIGYVNTTLATPKIMKNSLLKINQLNASASATVGAKSLVSLQYSNNGTLPIEKATMVIEGNISGEKMEIELEPLKDNEQKYIDCYVSFSKPGEQELKISFQYEDTNNNKYSIEPVIKKVSVKEFKTPVVKVQEVEQRWTIDQAGKTPIAIICGCIIAISLLISLIWVIKVQKGKGK